MGKKNSNEIQVIMDSTQDVESEVLESEAYQEPRPDVNVDATVLKTIGQGGPVPIVAPKRETIQLQPIVVPLAVVPYMAQDGGSLRTDAESKKKAQEQSIKDEANEAAIKEKIVKIEKTAKINKRVFSLFVFIFAALAAIPFILANFKEALWGINLEGINVIGQLSAWFGGVAPVNMAVTITSAISFIALLILCAFSLFGMIFGAFPHILNLIFAALSVLPVFAQIIYKLVINQFDVKANAFLIAIVVFAAIATILVEIGIAVLNKELDSIEDLNNEI